VEAIASSLEALNELESAREEQEIERINARAEAQKEALDKLTLTEEQKAAETARIEEEADNKTKAIQKEAAERNKKLALFNAIINVAQSVTAALASAPPPFSFILAGIAAAAGAVQIGAINATPLDAFEKGTDFASGGPAIVSEKGPELVVTPTGDLALTPEKQSIVNIERGSKVIPADKTAAIFDQARQNLDYMVSSEKLIRDFNQSQPDYEYLITKQTEAVRDALENQQQYIFSVGKNGMEQFVSHRGNKTKYYNERYK
jgi:hypothetical protein